MRGLKIIVVFATVLQTAVSAAAVIGNVFPPPSPPPPVYTPLTYAPATQVTTVAAVASPSSPASPSGPCPAATPPPEPNVDLSAWAGNGAAVAAIEPTIITYLQAKNVQDLGFSMYQQQPKPVVAVTGPTTTSTDIHQAVVSNHTKYCSKQLSAESGSTGFVCQPQTGGTANDAQYLQMGDVSTYVLLESLVYTPAVMSAAQTVIQKLVNPLPDGKYKGGVQNSSTQDFAKRLADHATFSVALNSFNEMFGMRTPDTTLGVSGGAGNSKLSIMQNEASRRFEETDSTNFTAVLSNPSSPVTELGALKQLAAMKAFKLWMDYQRFRQGERIEALLATQLSKYIAVSNEQAALMQH